MYTRVSFYKDWIQCVINGGDDCASVKPEPDEPDDEDDDSDEDSGASVTLSTNAIIGIAVGGGAAVLIGVAVLSWCIVHQRAKQAALHRAAGRQPPGATP